MLIDLIIDFLISIYFYIAIVFFTFTGFFLSLTLTIFSVKTNLVHYLLVILGRAVLFLSGCRVKVIKEFQPEKNKNYLIISNHQSIFDIFVINKILGFIQYRWLAKKSLFKIPILNFMLYLAGYISVDRANKYKAFNAIQKVIKILKKKKISIIIFPEGTRSREDKILKFKSGGIKIAISTGVEILPVVLKNTLYVKPAGKFFIKPMEIKVKILKPVSINGLTQAEAIDYLYNLICGEYRRL